MLSVVK